MKANELEGKIIESASIIGYQDYDDKPFLFLTFTDGTRCYIVADYGGFTGNSIGEYPAFIRIQEDINNALTGEELNIEL